LWEGWESEWDSVKAAYEPITGWFEPEAAVAFWLICRAMVSPDEPIVEIGAYCGRSTSILNEIKRKVGGVPAVTLDSFAGSSWMSVRKDLPHYDAEKGRFDSLIEYRETWWRNEFAGRIITVMGLSHEFARFWGGGPIGALLVDGTHFYDAIKLDIDLWCSKIHLGGYAMFHDYHPKNFPEVHKIVNELLGWSGWEKVALCGSLMVVRRVA